MFLGYIGMNDTPVEIKARLTDQHEAHAGNRKPTIKRITKPKATLQTEESFSKRSSKKTINEEELIPKRTPPQVAEEESEEFY